LPKIKILVAEDERIVAKDIQNTLRHLGYEVPAIVSTGEAALKKIAVLHPQLVLLDIVLKGNMDGIETAKKIRQKFKIPIIYLTAYEDQDTLNRAKITEPLGYILKPFDERALHTSIEMALYKHAMESRLSESEEKYRSLVEYSPDGIIIHLNRIITYVNPAAAKLIGAAPPDDLLGRTVMEFIPPENYDLLSEKIQYISEIRTALPFVEEKFINAEGKAFDVEVAMIPFQLEGKLAMQIVFRDITERKKAEAELRNAYSEIKKTQQALINSEKLAALGRFAAGIAHEIRNPLANISASAQFSLNKYEIEDQMKKHFEVILRNTESANRIIKELLDFTSPKEVLLSPGDVGNVIEHVCELAKTRCSRHEIELTKNISRPLPLISINERKLEEAFMNFVSNAIESMPQGGKLSISVQNSVRDNMLKVIFQDTGCGIEKINIDKVLEPFFTTKSDGTGLGLSLAYQIIKSHSGELKIESKKGEGTNVLVTFPAGTPSNIKPQYKIT
jgi:PAS domain S-box-containing protein